jgi:hypothetical protein
MQASPENLGGRARSNPHARLEGFPLPCHRRCRCIRRAGGRGKHRSIALARMCQRPRGPRRDARRAPADASRPSGAACAGKKAGGRSLLGPHERPSATHWHRRPADRRPRRGHRIAASGPGAAACHDAGTGWRRAESRRNHRLRPGRLLGQQWPAPEQHGSFAAGSTRRLRAAGRTSDLPLRPTQRARQRRPFKMSRCTRNYCSLPP